jgi:DNA-binding NtrC family response regulator
MEHLLLFVDEETVRLEDLPEGLGGARGAVEDLHGEFPTLAAGVRAFERYYIARVMSDQGADVQAAARRLGLRVDRLRRKLREM